MAEVLTRPEHGDDGDNNDGDVNRVDVLSDCRTDAG
jgi:hypothetical protein